MTATTAIQQSTTDGRSPIQITDFTIGRDLIDYTEVRVQATAFLVATNAEKGRLLARTIAATIEEGIVYEYMFHLMQKQGESWEQWVIEKTPYKPDTARHYRHVAKYFRDMIADFNDDQLNRTKMTALYQMAIQDLPVSTTYRFFDLLLKNPELEGDTKLVTIIRNPEIAARFEKHELTKQQAYDLCIVLADKRLNMFIKQLVLTEKVNHAGVVEYLNEIYHDWVRQSDDVRPNKSWADIVNNGHTLVWQDVSGEQSVHISEATVQDCHAYRNYRRIQHINNNSKDLQQSRATCNVIRNKDGSITLTLLDATALPVNFKSGTILVDLLPDTLEVIAGDDEQE